jgi:hypothetical protein
MNELDIAIRDTKAILRSIVDEVRDMLGEYAKLAKLLNRKNVDAVKATLRQASDTALDMVDARLSPQIELLCGALDETGERVRAMEG